MKTTFRIITLMVILHANSVFAANGAQGGGISLVGWIFIGFMAVIIIFQSIPAVMLFGSMMAGIFGKAKNRKRVTDGVKTGNS